MKAGWIKRYCAFLDESEYAKGSDYGRFMKALTSYKREGDNAHDSAPDGMNNPCGVQQNHYDLKFKVLYS